MRNQDRDVPVYLITGFLESGKTTFINNTVRQDYFQIPEKTLIIACEEGEEEYFSGDLMRFRTELVTVDEKEAFTEEFLEDLAQRIKPERVIIEYNPLWGMKDLEEMDLPEYWGVLQRIVLVDASTFQVYRNNMRSLFGDMCRNADLVLFNRAENDMPLTDFRRSIKAGNPACDVVFEGSDGRMINIFEDSVPYDLEADVITVEDIDFGIFYVDVREHPERYKGRKICFRGKVDKGRKPMARTFAVGRMAMTCCAADMSFIGYLCDGANPAKLENGQWVQVEAVMDWKFMKEYRGRGPVFRVLKLETVEAPETELVYFN